MKTYLKDFYGVTGSITDKSDGTATLKVRLPGGTIIHNKVHKNHKSAQAAWRRLNN